MFAYFYISFEIVFPILFFMGLGVVIKSANILTKEDFTKINTLVFKIFLPVKLFLEVYKSDFHSAFQLDVVIYAIAGILILFAVSWFAAVKIAAEPKDLVVIAQGMSRSNYVLFGMAIASGMYPDRDIGIVSVLAAFIVPLYNILSVFIYEYYSNNGKFNFKKLFRGIVSNPLIIGSFIGIVFIILNIQVPPLVLRPLSSLGDIATPLAVICIGATLSLNALKKYWKYIGIAVNGKLIFGPLLFGLGAIAAGIRGVGLAGIFLIFATPTATASYPMARELGGNDELAGLIVAVSNIASLFTLFLWIALLMSWKVI